MTVSSFLRVLSVLLTSFSHILNNKGFQVTQSDTLAPTPDSTNIPVLLFVRRSGY